MEKRYQCECGCVQASLKWKQLTFDYRLCLKNAHA